jgi:iron complex outermembrane receptor protein
VFTSYRFPFGLELGADFRHVGSRLGNDPTGPRFTMDDYQLLGAFAAYSWRQFTFTVRGRNLTDATYLAWSEDDYGNQALVGAPASVEVELRARF